MGKVKIDSVNEIDEAIKLIDEQMTELSANRKNLVNSKEILFKVGDTCPVCRGTGYTYRKSRGDDPHERSSDLRESCSRCSGSGRYVKLS